MPKQDNIDDSIVGFDDDPDPIPAKRDIRIFHRKKENKDDKDEDFEEDVFV